MKRIKKLAVLFAAIVLAAGLFYLPVLADAGHFSGSSSYGGGSSYSGGYSGGTYFVGGGGGGSDSAIALATVIIILIVIRIMRQSRINAATGTPAGGSETPTSELEPIGTFREKDPDFSEQAFCEKISNLYVQMQNAWQDKDFEPMRPYMKDSLYTQFDRQLDELRRSGQTNYVERIAVLGVKLSGWRSDETNDHIVAIVNTRIVDYTADDKTGKVVSGSKSIEKFMTYQWTMTRSGGKRTAAAGSEETTAKHCPSCGAPLDVNESARCPYCGSVVSSNDFNWVISEIRGIAQRNGR